ncbi:MAG: TonB-dependent receptor plug domain-containing protein [Verrucomicrobiota bacterium]
MSMLQPKHLALSAVLLAAPLLAQTATSSAPDAATLARYDTNRNGLLDPAELSTLQADQARARQAVVTSASESTSSTSSEVTTLNPFEVVENNRGYYGANTMAGTRLNSRIEDLASSITVVTKQQMADFAMLDINDIFAYEAGTEGAGNFTDFQIDQSGRTTDGTMADPNNANRIRGIGSANVSFGNFETSNRVPIDPLNIDAVEISRGPNSNIFGLGNAAGTVNLVPATANLSRARSQVQFRADSYGGYRGSLDINRVLLPGKLALRGSAAYQHDGYVRKPSGTDSTRLNAMVKYQPFKLTTLTLSHSVYRLHGNRPNMIMPRDAVSQWRAAGSPTWDPITNTAYRADGTVLGTFTGNPPAYFAFAGSISSGVGTSLISVGEGTVLHWTPVRTSTTATPQALDGLRLMTTAPTSIRATQPLFASDATVNDKSIYDWSEYNLAAMNRYWEGTGSTTAQLEHIFLNTPRHLLAAQAGWFREKSDRRQRALFGTGEAGTGAVGYIQVDVNRRLLDGTANPNYLRPNIGIVGGYTSDQPLQNDTYRGQLAYRLDLTQEKGLLRWLGMHQLSGYTEYKQNISRRFSFRDVMTSNHAWLAAGVPRGNQATVGTLPQNQVSPTISRNYFQYYIGDADGQNVDYAPSDFQHGTYTYTWGNPLAGGTVRREQVELGGAASIDNTGGTRNLYRILKTRGAVLQNHLLQGRIVTTFGLRRDQSYIKRGIVPTLTADGQSHDYDYDRQWAAGDWLLREGPTKTEGIVLKPLPWFHLHANRSDSFVPSTPAQNLHAQELPDPAGEGEDVGFTLMLFGGKLNIRANQYTTRQLNARNGTSATLAGRAVKMDIYDLTTARPFGLDLRARNWLRNDALRRGQTLSESQLDAAVAAEIKLPLEVIRSLQDGTINGGTPLAQTDELLAKGKEIELNYNPTQFWTMKLNVTEQEAIDAKVSPDLVSYMNERRQLWETIVDKDTGLPWYLSRYDGGQTPQQWIVGNVDAQLAIALANEGKSRPQVRKYRANYSTSLGLAGLTDNRWLKRFTVGGALRWEDKGAIGYYGVQSLPAQITALDRTRPVWAKANLYADAFVSYRTKMFSNKVAATYQLNVRNVQENGRLQAISAFPDGSPNGYRIVDPRQFILTATFDL